MRASLQSTSFGKLRGKFTARGASGFANRLPAHGNTIGWAALPRLPLATAWRRAYARVHGKCWFGSLSNHQRKKGDVARGEWEV